MAGLMLFFVPSLALWLRDQRCYCNITVPNRLVILNVFSASGPIAPTDGSESVDKSTQQNMQQFVTNIL